MGIRPNLEEVDDNHHSCVVCCTCYRETVLRVLDFAVAPYWLPFQWHGEQQRESWMAFRDGKMVLANVILVAVVNQCITSTICLIY
jgi:hypothetical protein